MFFNVSGLGLYGLYIYNMIFPEFQMYIIPRANRASNRRVFGSAVSNSVVHLAAERIHLYIEINNMRASLVWFFFAYKKIIGRTETRTRVRM